IFARRSIISSTVGCAMNPLDILWQYRIAFIDGFLVTVELVLFTALIGTGARAILELITSHFEGICRRAIDAIAFCFAAIPALVVLFWLYYPGQVLFRIDVSPFTTALVALSVMNTFAVYRIIADAVKDFPRQFITTALVCGLR